MKDAGSERGLMGAKHGLTDRMDKLIGRTANVFGVAAGFAWLYGVVAQTASWVWPCASGLAIAGALMALYRAYELERRLRQTREAFDTLERIAWAQQIEALKRTFADFEAAGEMPAARMAEFATSLKHMGGDPEAMDRVLDLIDEYERLREQRARGTAKKVADEAGG